MIPSVLRRRLSKFICWCTLKTIGFFFIDVEVLSKKFRISKETLKIPGNGDIVLANHSSWLDYVLLERLYSPVFGRLVRPAEGAEEKGRDAALKKAASAARPQPLFVPFDNLLQAIRFTAQSADTTPVLKPYSLQELAEVAKRKRLGPIVLFPEEATSNGRSILNFSPDFEMLLKGGDGATAIGAVFVASIKYSLNTKPFVCGSLWQNLWLLCLNIVSYVHFRVFPMSAVLKDLEETESYASSLANALSNETVSRCMCHVSRLKQVKLSAADKRTFEEYYKEKEQRHVCVQ